MSPIGRRRWAIAGGRIPFGSTGREPDLSSHDAIAVLNAGPRGVEVRITIFFADREPLGPYTLAVAARRVRRLRVNDLIDPQAVPLDTDYGALVEASGPVVVQFSRQDTRQAANALLGTLAFPLD